MLEPVERLDEHDKRPLPENIPKEAIIPVWLGCKSEHLPLSEAEIFLTDFGESFLPSTTQRYQSPTPRIYAPPEAHFSPEEPLSFPSDIWSLACTIWSILSGQPLFGASIFSPEPDTIIKNQVNILGKLPPDWWQKWDARLNWFNEEGVRIDNGGQSQKESDESREVLFKYVGGMRMDDDVQSWEELFESGVQMPRRKQGMDEVGEEETAALFDMLKAMMAFKPGERMTAEQVKESKWMRKWGLPELEELKRAQGK
jgi:serine/threonine-protein kinase SRPK3